MLTVIGFTKFRGFFSLNGKLKSPFGSNLGTMMFFSTGTGLYYPGPTWMFGSVVSMSAVTLNLFAADTNPLSAPFLL